AEPRGGAVAPSGGAGGRAGGPGPVQSAPAPASAPADGGFSRPAPRPGSVGAAKQHGFND
ncbi:MAG: hypothetical protein NW201_12145, partial [Gemmatimonadales bacterium]|nr:hypothetical protein [Gemmatimonadales bacterium]